MNWNPFDENCHFVYELDRASISSKKPGIDVTVKSAKGLARMCSPTWKMVIGLKDGTMTQGHYAFEYKKILDKRKIDIVSYLMAEACKTGGLLRFLCYCPDDVFCHTYLLMTWLQNELQIRHLVVRRLDHERMASDQQSRDIMMARIRSCIQPKLTPFHNAPQKQNNREE